jgi:hypothetical protein
MDLVQVEGMVKLASPLGVVEMVGVNEAFTLAD